MPPEVLKVLVVDDSVLILNIMKDILEPFPSLEVKTLKNAREAVDLLTKENDYRLVFMDIEMPGMSGLEALDELNYKGFDTRRIVAFSGDSSAELRTSLSARKVENFLQKPIEPKVLYEFLERHLDVKLPSKVSVPEKLSKGFEFSAVNVETTLQHFNGNLGLYEKSLQRFHAEYEVWLQETELRSAFAELKPYRFFLHTLKGVSAYVGAQKIVEQVSLVQEKLRQNASPASLFPLEAKLLKCLQEFLLEISGYLLKTPTAPASAPSPNHLSRGEVQLKLRQVAELLPHHDTEALDCMKTLDRLPLTARTTPVFQEVLALLLDYEFEKAIEPLEILLEELENEASPA